MQQVLVTGGSGFIAGHCILQLLDQGYRVRTTVRSPGRERSARAALDEAGMTAGNRLSFAVADLLDDAGWGEAMAEVEIVLHVASPVAPGLVDNEDDLIVPAREGTLRVLRAAQQAGVRRVVLTSAFHAVSWGWPHDDHVFTESDWTVLDGPGVDAYARSKTLAERAAWDFTAAAGGSMELVTMLPVAVMGPVIGTDISGSNHLIQALLTGSFPGLPHLYFPIVDVRDVAAAHLSAMVIPEAAGHRFLLSNGPAISMADIATTIRKDLGADATKVPTRTIPDWVVRLGGLANRQFRSIVPDLGYAKQTSNDKARTLLGWTPREASEAVLSAARSMVERGLVGKRTAAR